MDVSSRILINTISLYIKLIVTIIINLFLVRVVLSKLGVDDYGIYTLIAGVIALLSFLNSALMTSTQRYLSVAMGTKDSSSVNTIMTTSVIIHIALGVILTLVLEICEPFLFERIMTIEAERISAAKIVYQIMVVSMFITVVGVPYNALINSREDMWLFSLVEIICALLKLLIIVLFAYISIDALILYSLWMLFVSFLSVLIKYIWCIAKYPESHLKRVKGYVFKDLCSFTGWNALGSLAQAGRNQGVVLTINHFFGTSISAVFGIANQMDGNLVYFSQMMTSAMSPQIMKSYGQKDKDRMLRLSVFTSKLAFFLSGIVALPVLLEMSWILDIWLDSVPEFTEVYCSLVLLVFLILQLYPGLVRAIQATGRIKLYQIGQSLLLLVPIPIGIVLYNMGFIHYAIVFVMVIAQFLTMLFTIIIANIYTHLDLKRYCLFIIKAILIFVVSYSVGVGVKSLLSSSEQIVEFLVVSFFTCLLFFILYYPIVFDRQEKFIVSDKMRGFYRRLVHKFND